MDGLFGQIHRDETNAADDLYLNSDGQLHTILVENGGRRKKDIAQDLLT